METTYKVEYNRSIFDADSLEDAREVAIALVQSDMPFEAVVREDGVAVARYGPVHAVSKAEGREE